MMTPPTAKARKDPWSTEYVFEVSGFPGVYRRIVGGIAWPGPDSRSPSSVLCALAEERDKDFSTGQHIVRVLYEAEFPDMDDCLNEAAELTRTLKVQSWAVDHDAPEQVRVRQWTRDRAARRLPRLPMTQPGSVDFMVLHNLALKRTAAAKTMFFGDGSLAAIQYVAVPKEDYYRPLRLYPRLAACLYALSLIDLSTYQRRNTSGRSEPAEGGY